MSGDSLTDVIHNPSGDPDTVGHRLFEAIFDDAVQRRSARENSAVVNDTNVEGQKPGSAQVDMANGRVSKVSYPDGTSREFTYDKDANLSGITQPNGEVWKKLGDVWQSSKSGCFHGKISVAADGTYSFETKDRVLYAIKPDGSQAHISIVQLEKLNNEVKQHQAWQNNETYLRHGIEFLTSGLTSERSSLQQAEQLDTQGQQALKQFDFDKIQKLAAQVPGVLNQDQQALLKQQSVNTWSAWALRLGTALVPVAGPYLTSATWAADTASPGDSAWQQALDATCGGLTGAGLGLAVPALLGWSAPSMFGFSFSGVAGASAAEDGAIAARAPFGTRAVASMASSAVLAVMQRAVNNHQFEIKDVGEL